MKTLVCTVGLPRAGKSTWCVEMIAQGWIVINPDSIRLALHGKSFDPRVEGLVWTIARTSIKALFLAGHDRVILDATSVNRKSRKDWYGLLPTVEVRFKVFNTSKEVCIQRALANNQPDLIEVIERMSQKFQPLLPEEESFD